MSLSHSLYASEEKVEKYANDERDINSTRQGKLLPQAQALRLRQAGEAVFHFSLSVGNCGREPRLLDTLRTSLLIAHSPLKSR